MELTVGGTNEQTMEVYPTLGTQTRFSTSAGDHMTTDLAFLISQTTAAGYNVNGSAGLKNESDWGERDETLAKFEIAALAVILYLAIFGNAVVLVVLRMRSQPLSRMQFFIVHLTLADLFTAFFNVLPMMVWKITDLFYGNDFLCRTVLYLQVVAMYASSYVLIMTAIDRYLSICHPLTSHTMSPTRRNLMIVTAWLLSLLLALPQLFIFSMVEVGDGTYTCYARFEEGWGMKAYVTWMFVADYAVPFLILAYCYGRICLSVWASVGGKETYNSIPDEDDRSFRLRVILKKRKDQQTLTRNHSDQPMTLTSSKPRGHQRRVSRSKMKTIKLTLTVVLCYLICWAPYFVVQMWTVYTNLEHPVITVLMLMASLNSCTNPWIYLAFSGRPCAKNKNGSQTSARNPSTRLTTNGALDLNSDNRSRSSFIDRHHSLGRSRVNATERFSSLSKC